jgi:hypothetical protein
VLHLVSLREAVEIKLITTGKTEYQALGASLKALFPMHEFSLLTARLPGVPFDGFTSTPCEPLMVKQAVKTNLDFIASSAAAAAGVSGVDGVLILEDLELANEGSPQTVTEVVRLAFTRHVDTLSAKSKDRVRRALREKVSFHLAVPMLEAWFFADPRGLKNLGVSASSSEFSVSCNGKYEEFCTDSPPYIADMGQQCSVWNAIPIDRRTKRDRPPWLMEQEVRARHPKSYIQWLMRDPFAKKCTNYKETINGVTALERFDWLTTLLPPNELPYLRALVEDLANLLGVEIDLPPGKSCDLTSCRQLNRNAVLRNV